MIKKENLQNNIESNWHNIGIKIKSMYTRPLL